MYLWDDYTVTAEPFTDDGSLFVDDSPGWREFCADVLAFRPPDDELQEPMTG